MAASSAPVVKAALLTLLQARAGLSGVQVVWSPPGAKAEREWLAFGRTELDQQPAQLGNGTRREQYTLTLWVSVQGKGDDPQTVEERAWAIISEVETQLKSPTNADLALAGTHGIKSLTVQFDGGELDTFPEMESQTAQGPFRIAVDARI